jgi:hypothetical protein
MPGTTAVTILEVPIVVDPADEPQLEGASPPSLDAARVGRQARQFDDGQGVTAATLTFTLRAPCLRE